MFILILSLGHLGTFVIFIILEYIYFYLVLVFYNFGFL